MPDIEEALKFYADVLGFERMKGGKCWGNFDFREFDAEPFAKNAGFMDGHCKVDCTWMYHPHLQLNLELMHFYVEVSTKFSMVGIPNSLSSSLYDVVSTQCAENLTSNMPKTQDIGGIKHISFVVEDIDKAFQFLKKQSGVRFVTDDPSYKPHQLEPFPFKFFYFIDPFGVQWEIEEYGDAVGCNRIPSVVRQMDPFIQFK